MMPNCVPFSPWYGGVEDGLRERGEVRQDDREACPGKERNEKERERREREKLEASRLGGVTWEIERKRKRRRDSEKRKTGTDLK